MLIYRRDEGPYLAGSVHVLPADRPGIPPELVQIYERTSSLVLECQLDDYDGGLRYLPKGEFLDQIISPDSYERVMARAAQLGVQDLEELRSMKPWACIFQLAMTVIEAAGLSYMRGVDSYFRELAKEEENPLYGLEPSDTVHRLLDTIPLQLQETHLLRFLDEIESLPDKLGRLIQAWRVGDATGIEEGWLSHMPFRDLVLSIRNRMWATGIERGCQEQPDALVLVGVAHLVGPGNLIRLLRSRGIQFNRL